MLGRIELAEFSKRCLAAPLAGRFVRLTRVHATRKRPASGAAKRDVRARVSLKEKRKGHAAPLDTPSKLGG
jgi:hypothetical protein